MEFRPCIDIHNGKVKQIVGGSLTDDNDYARENFVSEMGAGDYARLYKKKGLRGGHIILLNKKESDYYEADLAQAEEALAVWEDSLQIGGGVTAENAADFIKKGASHVIVTSYVFENGEIRFDRLKRLVGEVGKEHLVLDLSCRKKEEQYFIVTDRWQKFTRQPLETGLIQELAAYCDEFLVHAVNVEGTGTGVDEELLALLAGQFLLAGQSLLAGQCSVPITYAGGIGTMADIEKIQKIGKGRINFTVGSALDLFGGALEFNQIINKFCK